MIFGSSADLASACGIAVAGDMVITSILASVLSVKVWKRSRLMTALVISPLLLIDLVFLAANGTKLMDGGYIPVLMAAVMCRLMWTWLRGSVHARTQARRHSVTIEALTQMVGKSKRLKDVRGQRCL